MMIQHRRSTVCHRKKNENINQISIFLNQNQTKEEKGGKRVKEIDLMEESRQMEKGKSKRLTHGVG